MATNITAEELARAIIKQVGSRPSLSNAGSGRNGGTPSERAASAKEEKILKDNTSAIQYLRDTLNKNSSLLSEMNHINKASNKVFNQAVDSVSSLKELNKLPAGFKEAMMRSSSSLAKMMSSKMDSLESMFAAQEKIENLPQVKNLMDAFAKGNDTIIGLQGKIEELGYTTDEAQSIINKFGKEIIADDGQIKQHKGAVAMANHTVKMFDKEIKAANLGVADFAKNIETQVQKPGFIGMMRGIKGSIIAALAKDLLNASQASLKFGTELNGLNGLMAGMKPEEFSRMQADNRQAINALTGGFGEFDSLISDSNKELTKYTGSLRDSTQLVASMITTSKLMGDASVNTKQFINSQKSVFADFNRHLSMTSEQFAALNQSLIQDVDVRTNLYKMNQKQRQAHFEGLQQEYKTYRIMGMLPGQAENLVKAMEKLSGKTAKDRLKESAKLRAIMGGMGMGAQGERAQQLMLKGSRASASEKQELAKILIDAQGSVSERMQRSFYSELQTQEMIGKGGLEQYLGPQSPFVDALLGKGAAAKGTPDAVKDWTSAIGKNGEDIVGSIHNLRDVLMAFLGTNFITALVVAFGGKSILGKLGNLMGGKGGKAGKLLGGLGKLLSSPEGGSMLSKMGRGLGKAGIVGTVANVGMGLYDMSQNGVTGKNVGGMVGGTAGAAIGGALGSVIPVVGTMIGATIGGAVGKWGGEALGQWVTGDKTDAEAEKRQKLKDETQEKINKTLEQLHEAMQAGNEAAVKTAQHTLETQQAIMQQTNKQSEDAEKSRNQTDSCARKMLIRDRTGAALSPQ